MTYPTIRPELTLDFANSRQLDPRITFSRSSGATYLNPDTGLITLASDHEARFEKEGLLIEESRTNAVLYSEDFQNQWSVGGGGSGGSATNSQTVSPDGNNTGAKFAAPATRYLTETTTETGMPNTGVRFNLATGTFDSVITGSPDSYDIDPAVNGWYRCWFTVSNLTFSVYAKKGELDFIGIQLLNSNVFIYALNSTYNQTSTTDGIYLWGAQLEANAVFPTSYIPTAGATATRSPDIAQMTGDNFSSWYNQSESTVVTKMTDNGEPNTTFNRDIYYLGTGLGSGNNRIITTTGSGFGAYVQTTGAQVSITGGWYTKGVETVGAFAFKQDNFALATDGVIRGTDNSGDLPTCDRLYLFMNRNKANTLTGHISRLAYYSRRLTDLELETITL